MASSFWMLPVRVPGSIQPVAMAPEAFSQYQRPPSGTYPSEAMPPQGLSQRGTTGT